MPGQYKKKECPSCGAIHRGRGQYCSKSCSNTKRKGNVTEKVRIAAKKAIEDYRKTPEGIAHQKQFFKTGLTPDEFAVGIPEMPKNLRDYSEFDDYESGEDW